MQRYSGAYASVVSFAIEYRLDFVLDLRVTGHLMKTESCPLCPFNLFHLAALFLLQSAGGLSFTSSFFKSFK